MVIRLLSELEPEEKGTIIRVGGKSDIRRRLLDMGIVAGAEVKVLRVAPLGDPMEISIKGYDLALRKGEAANIQVESAYLKKDLVPLNMFSRDNTAEVAVVRAGWGLQRRLADMGIIPGVTVKIISGGRPGPIAVEVRGSKLILGQGVAGKIMVVPEETR